MEEVKLNELPAFKELLAVLKDLDVNDNLFMVNLTKAEIRLIIRGLELLFKESQQDQMALEDIVDLLYSMKDELVDQLPEGKIEWARFRIKAHYKSPTGGIEG